MWPQTYEHSELILSEISFKRNQMMQCANEKGFTDEDTIKYSQELDRLIYLYQTSFPLNKESNGKNNFERPLYFLPKALVGIVHLVLIGQ